MEIIFLSFHGKNKTTKENTVKKCVFKIMCQLTSVPKEIAHTFVLQRTRIRMKYLNAYAHLRKKEEKAAKEAEKALKEAEKAAKQQEQATKRAAKELEKITKEQQNAAKKQKRVMLQQERARQKAEKAAQLAEERLREQVGKENQPKKRAAAPHCQHDPKRRKVQRKMQKLVK